HQISLTTLNPESTYYYGVESGDLTDDNSGSYYSFTTPAPDTTAPSLTVEFPASVVGNSLELTGTSEAGATVNVYVNDVFRTSTVAEAEENSTTAIFSFSNLLLELDTTNLVKVEAVDAAGNIAFLEGTIFTDASRPELTLEPIPSLTGENRIPIKGTVSENSSIEILVNNRSIAQLTGTVIDEEVSLEEGENKIEIIAQDEAGWETREEFTVISDTRPPQVQIELSKGREYYEGRAETDITGETEPGATVYLYIYQPRVDDYNAKFDRAQEKTTADSEGKFKFTEISFPPPIFSSLEELAPREVPSGLEDVLVPSLEDYGEEQQKTYNIYVIAEDSTGKTGYDEETVHVNTCYSGNFAFDIAPHPDFPPQPFRLDPQLIEEGRETIGAVFQVEYKGGQVAVTNADGQVEEPYEIMRVDFEKACTRQNTEEDDYKLGCQLLSRLVPHGNSDNSVFYVTGNLQRADDFLDTEDDFWDDFQKRQLKIPLKILVSYREREPDGGMGERKIQASCYDLGYFVDIPIDSSDLVPDFLADQGVAALNWTIQAIEDIKPILETAMIVAGVSCGISMFVKFIAKLYRNFQSYLEAITSVGEDGCPSVDDQDNLFLDSTIEDWSELRGRPNSRLPSELNSLSEKCPGTAGAWSFESTLDKLYKFTCDRFFCREVPAGWTAEAEYEDVRAVQVSQDMCAATSNCVQLRKIENCREDLEENAALGESIMSGDIPNECYLYEGYRYGLRISDNDPEFTDRGVYRLSPLQDFGDVGGILPPILYAYKPEGSEDYCVAEARNCASKCRQRDGFQAVTDGIDVDNPPEVTSSSTTLADCAGRGFNVRLPDDNEYLYNCKEENNFAQRCEIITGEISQPYSYIGNRPLEEACTGNVATPGEIITGAVVGDSKSSGNGPCYREEIDGRDVNLLNVRDQPMREGQIAVGYTRDCFIDTNTEQLYQCVCEEEDLEQYGRGATDTNQMPREALKAEEDFSEPWIYRQDKIFKETGGETQTCQGGDAGTCYPKWRYYGGRDFTAAFGLDYGFDNFRSEMTDMTSTTVDPGETWGAFQTLCLPKINAHLTMLQSFLVGLRNCIIEAKTDELHDAGMCKAFFTQHVCGLIYRGLSAILNDCSPSVYADAGEEEEVTGIEAGWDAFRQAIPDTISSSQQEIREDYGASAEDYFGAQSEGLAQSMCLGFFGYDVPILDLDLITEAAYSVPIKSSIYFTTANRELTTYDPSRGTATYSYNLGGMIMPGCKIRGYNINLKCVGIEDLGNPGIDQSCDGQGCDCLQIDEVEASTFAGERSYQVPGGRRFGEITRLQMYDFPIESPLRVSSNYRYDHVVVDLFLEQGEDPQECFDEGFQTSNGAKYYFPI
ncbi:MAG: hypothetical protein KKH52_00210, partial [Nanoarchaeota archaeon]|nr:hypothetical protein [Nanoarchaeota archaeon]